MGLHGELAVVQQVKRAEQLTADRDRLSFFCPRIALPLVLGDIGSNGIGLNFAEGGNHRHIGNIGPGSHSPL